MSFPQSKKTNFYEYEPTQNNKSIYIYFKTLYIIEI